MPCSALRCSPIPSALPAPLAPARFARAVVKEALPCLAMHCCSLRSSRDVAAPFVAASYPVATARKQALQCPARRYFALRYNPIVALRPRSGQRLPAGPVRIQAVHCGAVLCLALPCYALPSAHAVNLCSHFFRLACFKLCQIVASELGAVVAKPFKHGRMHKRILHIGHVQNFGDNRH